jgi:hypothetical protein
VGSAADAFSPRMVKIGGFDYRADTQKMTTIEVLANSRTGEHPGRNTGWSGTPNWMIPFP